MDKETNSSVTKESTAKVSYMGGEEDGVSEQVPMKKMIVMVMTMNKVAVVPRKKMMLMMTVNIVRV